MAGSQQTTPVIDEAWLTEWLKYGFRDLERYLAKHAAFSLYLEHRGLADEAPPVVG